ncbi:DUF4397 domain-containing protein [Anaerotignum sp.]|uniref:DUF4397 domain-containing protein n=1 Tax=Anaerotignum sp. TaxID=2039241 RepID=UPI0028A24956|nr:DUF4397 domain-containing protein [Anaerotignum sp.]
MCENNVAGMQTYEGKVLPLPIPEEELWKLDQEVLTPAIHLEPIREILPEINIVPDVKDMEIPIIAGITLYSYLNFFNALVSVPAIDIYINGKKVVSDLKYSEFTEYYLVFPGYYRIQIFEAGKTEDEFSTTVINLIGYRIYTVTISGLEDHACLLLVNDCIYPVPEDYAYLRFVQISPNAPLLKVYFDDNLVLTELDYREISRYLSTTAQVHDITFRDYISDHILLEVHNFSMENETAYTAYTLGDFFSEEGLQIVIAKDGISHLTF